MDDEDYALEQAVWAFEANGGFHARLRGDAQQLRLAMAAALDAYDDVARRDRFRAALYASA